MTSVASASPSGRSFHRAESTEDSDSWQYIGSHPASVFIPSPQSGASSMNSWAIVPEFSNQPQHSPAAVSPLHLDNDPQSVPSQSFPNQSGPSMMATVGGMENQYIPDFSEQQLMSDPEFMFFDSSHDTLGMEPYYNTNLGDIGDFDPLDFTTQPGDLGIPQQYRNSSNVSPWSPPGLMNDEPSSTLETDFRPSFHALSSPTDSGNLSSSPKSPPVKVEKAPSPIRKIKGSGSKIEKRKPDSTSKFVIMTPNTISASAGKPNPFECFEAMRTTQKGRKGPLANEVKESALQVRRLGACFCCHARKVKCDKERPCKNCTKLTTSVPQIICWQFQDFLPVLFPDFIRGHFRKEEMAAFVSDHIQAFTINGVEKPCEVELYSGARFQSTLKVRAKFFTAKTTEVLQHWHMNVGMDQVDMQYRRAAPIGIELDNAVYREDLRRRTRDYIQGITVEPQYAEQVTDSLRATRIPRRVLKIVQRYGLRSQSPIVKKALSIYATHYVLTRHLCLTPTSVHGLEHTKLVPQDVPWLTPRVLNRQIKSMLDELLQKDMQGLFDSFSKSLKPKSRKEWAPCVAAFLVLCLFMEAVETAADTFVISQNEINIRNKTIPEYKREFALQVCKEVENLPFKQFAYQFHQVYQTHTRDASTKAFNPLQDYNFADQGDLDGAALEMVIGLRELLQGDSFCELDFLVADPILPNQETHPFPRDVSLNYTGRLLARFLLSFVDDKYLFDGKY
ncbi:uncharacterized protein JN550_000353 [Neoarthrinium moseri]|uniref:uncharacterized protein n=1 Tax=Neoarthrinium moseri TaxID=1658444 RepID=UPI001FDBFED5|nr:uncharacterized protein JN550_000353 [Neoarthrinium moseri]KAI1878171.1 hypothetical protein JN550_000353 [Neoarthrinium moseri]